MDKRLLNFMLISMLLFIGYMEFLKIVRPAPEVDPNANQDAVAAKDDADGEPIAPVEQLADAGTTASAEANPDDPAVDSDDSQPEEAKESAQSKLLTLGSLDPATGYSMLVTFNSKGGAVERVELSNPKYRDLYDKTAYIGHLGLTSEADGLRVNVVGDGTPAEQAGIQVGDVLSELGEASLSNEASFAEALSQYKYGEDIPVTFLRNGSSQSATISSMRRPLEILRPEAMPNNLPGVQQLSYLVTLHQVGARQAKYGEDEIAGLASLRDSDWYSDVIEENGETVVEFRFPLSEQNLKKIGVNGSLEVVKRFTLATAEGEPKEWTNHNYHFDFDLQFVNNGGENIEVGYRLDGPTGLPLEGWWYSYKTHPTSFAGAGVRDVVWRAHGEGHDFQTNPMVTKWMKKNPESPEKVFVNAPKRMQYLGVDAQYFTSCILASNDDGVASVMLDKVDARTLSPIDEQRASRTPITFRADSSMLIVPAGKTQDHKFEIFAGPKHPEVLDDYGLDECIVYGWFSAPARLMGWLLHSLYWVVGNYGISIILLTVLVRACMVPIGRQQAMNAKKMQELTPEIKKIKEKYPTDTEKQAKAQQELFRKHNYNPVAGCLPMFLQLPIFIGLYRALSVDIELRQTPLIPGLDWCANLAGPDMFYRWDSVLAIDALTSYTGYLGPYLNVLPMISTGLFLVHQQMFTPPPTDEQQEMQQKVMKFMMLFMLVLFFKVPAGLCLYFITSSLWALGERMLLPKDAGTKTEVTPVSLSSATAGAEGGSSSGNTATAAAVAKKKRRKRGKK